MAQKPPRMPRRPTSKHSPADSSKDLPNTEPQKSSPKVIKLPAEQSAAAATPATELPTDAMNVLPATDAKTPSGRRAKNTAQQPAKKAGPEKAERQRVPRLERAKQKQSQRRKVDRVKFSAAVRRKPGEAAPTAAKEAHPEQKPVAAHRFSGRVAALLVVLAFFAVMLVPTVNHYRHQMQEINELRASISQLETEQQQLKEEIARWDDPLYIKQQARDRINLVMPGERVYMVVGEQPAAEEAIEPNASTYEVRQELPWVDALLDSIHRSATD
ncbi:septum formation initiator family protein [Glutamicibacter uratoxydans]|uniref:FtsB family cell division protein n=1 Tax=Glutamicibacter uratoxydans TaxID=43667 RepID=UPI003D6E13F0